MQKTVAPAHSADYVKSYVRRALGIMERIPQEAVVGLIDLIRTARDREQQIFLCGNGGSAATASHFANDLGKGASLNASRRFRVLSLTDNVSWMTALANDTDYSKIFVEPLKNYARSGDLLVAFSGSGNSPNVLEAVRWANENGVKTVGVTGRPGGELARLARHAIHVESDHMGHIEEGHFLIQHLVGYYFMEADRPQKPA